MKTRITEDFFKSLGRLSPAEQKKANSTVLSIYHEETNSGLRAHKIEHPSNKIFSYSVNMDLRIIVHSSSDYTTILYIDHHDDAYNWVAKRKFVDGSDSITIIQTVNQQEELRETNKVRNQLAWGREVDPDIQKAIEKLKSDDEVVDYILGQPEEIQDQLLEIVQQRANQGGYRVVPEYKITTVTDDKYLKDALKYPLELWRVFLHPRQKELVEKDIDHSVFITGCPGTGKTVCLIHRISRFSKQIASNECIVFGTFKKGLAAYLESMLSMLDTDMNKVFIEDISELKLIEPGTAVNAKLDGFYQVDNGSLYYYNKGRRLRVRHLVFDEYQDYKQNKNGIIIGLSRVCPYTIAFDYSQAIYRSAKYTIDNFSPGAEIIVLDYTYRIGDKILERLKRIMAVIKTLSSEDGAIKFDPLFEIEEEVISRARSVVSGDKIELYPYSSINDLTDQIGTDYSSLCTAYKPEDIIVTAFFSDLFKTLSCDADYHSDSIPESVRPSYAFAPTLKGKEFKAGLIVLDDTVCQMLNINQLLLKGKLNSAYLGGHKNYRLNLNLLYVVISRFRDYIKVYYPQKYEILINPIFE